MKKIILLVIAVSMTALSEAKSLRELWVSMPDTLMPAFNKNIRTEYVELQDMGVKAEVKNLLQENCVLDTLTQDFMQLRMGKTYSLQMKLLASEGSDSILCMVKTFAAPEKESEVLFFDQQWKPISFASLFGGKSLEMVREGLVAKPDTMTEARFEELKLMIEPKMMSAILFQHENSIVFRLALPLLNAEDKMKIKGIKMQRKFNWRGKTFNES